TGGELARLDHLLQLAQVDHRELQPVRLGEAALGQAAVQRHLAAFVAVQRHARPRGLALDTAAAHFALARTRATADPLFLAVGAFVVAKLVQFHVAISLAGNTPNSDKGMHTDIESLGRRGTGPRRLPGSIAPAPAMQAPGRARPAP